jgi:hypothetical protein
MLLVKVCKMGVYSSTGILKYSENPYKLIVLIDKEITNYYRSLIPKYVITNRQMYPPHISVVRKEEPVNLEAWNKYQDQEIDFEYENIVYSGEVYIWLNVFSSKLEEIRLELGLPVTSLYTRPPGEYKKVFHTTLGNYKGLS